jgi:hypothetical protein
MPSAVSRADSAAFAKLSLSLAIMLIAAYTNGAAVSAQDAPQALFLPAAESDGTDEEPLAAGLALATLAVSRCWWRW